MVVITENVLYVNDIVFDKTRKSISFSARCTGCGKTNKWENVRFFTRNVLSCSECGKKHKLPILKDLAVFVNESVNELLDENKKIAFWGVNDYFANFVEHLDIVLNNKNCYIVDIAKTKQGAQLFSKTILSPEIIKEEAINTVVIPVISAVDTIRKQIQQEYKGVKNIYSILDLID